MDSRARIDVLKAAMKKLCIALIPPPEDRRAMKRCWKAITPSMGSRREFKPALSVELNLPWVDETVVI